MKSCLTDVFTAVSVVAVIATAAGTARLAGQQAPPAAPPAQAAPIKSPEIHPDRTVTFRLAGAQGDRGHAERQLGQRHQHQDDEGRRRASGRRPWARSPRSCGATGSSSTASRRSIPATAKPSATASRYDNLLMISGPESEWWDFKDVPHGSVQAVWYPSPTLKHGQPPDDGLHAARLRDRHAEVSGALPAARRRR